MRIHLTILIISVFIVTYVAFNNTTLPIILFGVTVDISLTSIATGIIVGELITREKPPHKEGVTTTSVILLSVFLYFFSTCNIIYVADAIIHKYT